MEVSEISICGELFTLPSTQPVVRPAIQPTATPPTNTRKNSPTPDAAVSQLKYPASTTASNIFAATSAVASLNKLSPSTRMVRRFGAPICLNRSEEHTSELQSQSN